MGLTSIEWANRVWNPWVGCTRVNDECDGCYAKDQAARLARMGVFPYVGGELTRKREGKGLSRDLDWTGAFERGSARVRSEPLRWRRPNRVFVGSMSDFFHPAVPLRWRAQAVALMAATPAQRYLLLTKRPHLVGPSLPRLLELALDLAQEGCGAVEARPLGWIGSQETARQSRQMVLATARLAADGWPRNAWIGASCGKAESLIRIDALRRARNPGGPGNAGRPNGGRIGRFLSLEPLLEPLPALDLDGIDWVIVGGESGPNARPMEAAWVRPIRDECLRRGVPFFFKQWGGPNKKRAGRLLDGEEHLAVPPELEIRP